LLEKFPLENLLDTNATSASEIFHGAQQKMLELEYLHNLRLDKEVLHYNGNIFICEQEASGPLFVN